MVEGGTAHGFDHEDQLVSLWGAPAPVYKEVEEERAGPLYGAP